MTVDNDSNLLLLFPAFMYGDRTTCRRKLKAEAKKWAKCYMEGRVGFGGADGYGLAGSCTKQGA